MSAELQARAKAFLQRPVPKTLDYVADSMAEQMLATYAKRGRLPEDSESAELLELVIMQSSEMARQAGATEIGEYFRESAAILEAIQAEG